MSKTQKKRMTNFLVQGSILAVAGLICRLIGLVYRMPMTLSFKEEGLGYYDSAYSIYNIALIVSSYGMPLAVSKLVAAKVATNEYKNARRVLMGALTFAITTGLITSLVVFFGADFFATSILNSPNSAVPLKVLSPTIFLCAIMGTLRGYFQGNSTMIPTSVSQILEQIVNAIVSVVATVTFMNIYRHETNRCAYGAAGGTLGTTSGAIVGLIVLIIIFISTNKVRKEKIKSDTNEKVDSYKDIFKLILATVVPVILSQTLYNLNAVVDRILFNRMYDASEQVRSIHLGVYAKYVLLVNIPVAIATALGNSIVPVIVSEKVKGNVEGMKSKIDVAIRFNMLIAIPATFGFIALAPNIFELLFKGQSTGMSSIMLRIGALAVAFYALSTISNAILQAMNHMSLPLIHSAISFVVHLGVIVLLLKPGLLLKDGLGIYSLAIGNVVFALGVCILNWRSIAKKLQYKQEIKTTFVIPTIASIVMGAVTSGVAFGTKYGMGQVVHSSYIANMIATLVAILVAVIVYAIALVAFKGITKDELMRMPKGNTIYRIFCKLHLLK